MSSKDLKYSKFYLEYPEQKIPIDKRATTYWRAFFDHFSYPTLDMELAGYLSLVNPVKTNCICNSWHPSQRRVMYTKISYELALQLDVSVQTEIKTGGVEVGRLIWSRKLDQQVVKIQNLSDKVFTLDEYVIHYLFNSCDVSLFEGTLLVFCEETLTSPFITDSYQYYMGIIDFTGDGMQSFEKRGPVVEVMSYQGLFS